MKRFFALALSVLMALSITACGAKEEAPAATPSAPAASAPAATTPATPAAPALKYPEGNIDMAVGFKAGGGTYLSAQMLTNYNDIWGTAINLVEKAGSGGAIAADYVANAKADGYTTLFTTAALPISIGLGDVEFAPEALVGVAQCTEVCQVLAVAGDAPYNNVEELIAYANANPGSFVWAYPGTGSSLHIMGTYVLDGMGILDNTTGIPYDSTSEAIAAILGGHINGCSMYTTSIGDYVEAGQLKIIGILSEERDPNFDYIPTYKEQGVGIQPITVWRGVFAPADTPAEILNYLDEKLTEICNSDDFAKRATELGETASHIGMKEFNEKYQSEIALYKPILESLGLV